MSIAGLNDAIRSDRPLTERIVWHTLESHANGARFWAMTHLEIATELHISEDSVTRAITALAKDGIIRIERKRRRKTVFHMLRTYNEQPAHKPPPLPWHENELTPQDAESNTELTPQDAESSESEAPELTPQIADVHPELNPHLGGAYKNSKKESNSKPHAHTRAEDAPEVWRNGKWIRVPNPPMPKTTAAHIAALEAVGSPDPETGTVYVAGFDLAYTVRRACEIARIDADRAGAKGYQVVGGWLRDGIETPDILAIIRRATERDGYVPPYSLGYFDRSIRAQRTRAGSA